ncbi:hypothetical protein EI94DRAFT_1716692, partial [Lactarius quietus]
MAIGLLWCLIRSSALSSVCRSGSEANLGSISLGVLSGCDTLIAVCFFSAREVVHLCLHLQRWTRFQFPPDLSTCTHAHALGVCVWLRVYCSSTLAPLKLCAATLHLHGL